MKEAIRYYYTGYLNEYNVSNLLLTKSDGNYKNFKIKQTLDYLGISNRWFLVFLKKSFLLVVVVEPCLYLFVLFILLLKNCINKIGKSTRVIHNQKLFFGLYRSYDAFKNITSSVDFEIKDFTVVIVPGHEDFYKDFKKFSLLYIVSWTDILKSFIGSLFVIFYSSIKYCKKDLFFRSYNSFDFLLSFYALSRLDGSNEIIFHYLIDRWAYLFGSWPYKKIFIQHGILNANITQAKCGSIEVGYFINDSQEKLCKEKMFFNVNISKRRKQISISSIKKIDSKKYILLICNSFFYDIEKKILSQLKDIDAHVIIKLHPKDKNNLCYNDFLNNNSISIAKDFIDADIVISYASSLADEYEDCGKNVFRYSPDIDREGIDSIISKIKEIL